MGDGLRFDGEPHGPTGAACGLAVQEHFGAPFAVERATRDVGARDGESPGDNASAPTAVVLFARGVRIRTRLKHVVEMTRRGVEFDFDEAGIVFGRQPNAQAKVR